MSTKRGGPKAGRAAAAAQRSEPVHTDEEAAGAGGGDGAGAGEEAQHPGAAEDGEEEASEAGDAPPTSQRTLSSAAQIRAKLEALRAQKELDEFMRKDQEEKKQQAARGKKQGGRRGKRVAVEEDEEEKEGSDGTESESEEEEPVKVPKKKARRSLTLEETLAAALAPPVVKVGAVAKSLTDMDTMMSTYFGPNRWRTARSEAEGRRIFFLIWQIASMAETTAKAAASAARTAVVVNPMIAVGEAMIKALMTYDHATAAPGVDGQTIMAKVRELEHTIVTAATVPTHGLKAREMLAVPTAFLLGTAKGAHKKKKEEEAAAAPVAAAAGAEARMANIEAMLTAMGQGQQRQSYQQPPFNQNASSAQQQMGQQIPFQQQQQHGYGRPFSGVCHACGLTGHIAIRCPNPGGKGANGAPAAAAPGVSTQSRGHTQLQYELAPKWQQQYSPEWHRQDAPEWQAAAAAGGRLREEGREADVEMVGMGVGVAWMDRHRTEQLSSSGQQVFNVVNTGQRAAAAGAGRLVTQPTCSCGRCGACIQGIDLLHKEQRENKRVAKKPLARALEEALERAPDVPRKVIQIAEDLQVWAEEKRESWRLEHGVNVMDERDEGYKAGRGAPDKAPMPIGKMVGTGNKRHFDRMSLGPCGFCKRKGHNKETCMVMPVFRADGGQQTELQKRKVAFVQGLLERKPRTAEERMMRPGENRLDAVKRAIAVGEEANRGNPWMTSEKRRDKLRRRLGYWWAIGADRVVLSWIGYGVELKFERPPPRLYFANHRSYSEHEEHVEKEHVQHLADGSFEEVDGSEVQIGNPR